MCEAASSTEKTRQPANKGNRLCIVRIVCFQHVAYEGPAAIADWALARGHTLECVDVSKGVNLPGPQDFDMLVIMGGPMNIYETSAHPWLTAEKAVIREAIDKECYLVGVCLGSQLIADQLGSAVVRGDTPEIGWWPVRRAADCPEAVAFPEALRVYHWHGDTFAIPKGAQHLFESDVCTSQGFLYGQRILGLQCHLEVIPTTVDALIDACGDELHEGPAIQTAAEMRAEPPATYAAMHAVLFQLLDTLTRDG